MVSFSEELYFMQLPESLKLVFAVQEILKKI